MNVVHSAHTEVERGAVGGARRTPPLQRTLTFRAFRGLEGLASIQADWNRVVKGMSDPRFFHLFEWYESYSRTLVEDPASLFFFVASHDKVPIGIFPLELRSGTFAGVPARTLELPQGLHLSICDFVFEKSEANAGLVSALVEHLHHEAGVNWDVAVLSSMMDDSASWFSVQSAPPAGMIVEPSKFCDYLDSMPFDDRLGLVSKNFRGALRKARNKLAQEKDVEVFRLHDIVDVPPAVEEFLELEARGWKGAAGTAIKSDPRVANFYRTAAVRFAGIGASEINLLRIGDRCVAGQFCFRVGRALNILKIGYDEERSKLAPGNMLLESVMRRCADESDVDTINLVSDAAWHADWKPRRAERHTAMIFNSTFRGRAVGIAMHAKDVLRPYYRRYLKPTVEKWQKKRTEPDERHPPAQTSSGEHPILTEPPGAAERPHATAAE